MSETIKLNKETTGSDRIGQLKAGVTSKFGPITEIQIQELGTRHVRIDVAANTPLTMKKFISLDLTPNAAIALARSIIQLLPYICVATDEQLLEAIKTKCEEADRVAEGIVSVLQERTDQIVTSPVSAISDDQGTNP